MEIGPAASSVACRHVGIQKNAHTGLRGDGKIYISNIEECIRIATGNSGRKAV